MGSTHYMDLLMQNSPWNLILFMAIPVALAESMAISELFLLFQQDKPSSRLKTFNTRCGILAGMAFVGIFIYFIPNVVLPLTKSHSWRTWIDVVAIVSYLAAGIPMIIIALLNAGFLGKNYSQKTRQLCQIGLLSLFLVLSHVAMIFGMVDPSIAGWNPPTSQQMEMGQHYRHSASDASQNMDDKNVRPAQINHTNEHIHAMEPHGSMDHQPAKEYDQMDEHHHSH